MVEIAKVMNVTKQSGSEHCLILLLSLIHILPGAILYLRVYFLGMVPNVIYNMGTCLLYTSSGRCSLKSLFHRLWTPFLPV